MSASQFCGSVFKSLLQVSRDNWRGIWICFRKEIAAATKYCRKVCHSSTAWIEYTSTKSMEQQKHCRTVCRVLSINKTMATKWSRSTKHCPVWKPALKPACGAPTNKMVKRCVHVLCKSDTSYPMSLLGGVLFFSSPKPKTQLEHYLQWINHSGQPHSQLTVSKINKHSYICSKVTLGLSL